MELVCRESRRPFTWFYNLKDKLYVRKDQNGRENGRITGRNLPDPLGILETRTLAKTKGMIPLGARVHADPVTIKLWEHYHANSNN